MRVRARWGTVLLLAMATVWLAADVSEALAVGRDSARAESWEFTLPVRFVTGETIDFEHGTSIKTQDDIGWGFGLGYNMTDHINMDLEFAWSSVNYDLKLASAEVPPRAELTGSGIMDVTTTQFNFTYYFQPKSITAYVSAGFGWNWFDSNIPSGPATGGCWWDPWYGYICGTYQNTYSTTTFTYGLGAGVRIEPKDNLFIRLGLNDNWQDFGSHSGTKDILTYRLEMGWKF